MKNRSLPESPRLAKFCRAFGGNRIEGLKQRRKVHARWVLPFATAVGLCACDRSAPQDLQARASPSEPLIVAVVGTGVPTARPPRKRMSPLNRAQGIAMWKGAKSAFDNSPRAKNLQKYVRLVGYDDGGAVDEAARIAEELQSNPRALAVIGHATSGTTREAAWRYARAGIPLLMPIATSPNVIYPPGVDPKTGNPLSNTIRLPPSDDRVQAPAVAFLTLKKLQGKRCYLLRDVSEDAVEYAQPLYGQLEFLLADKIVKKQDISSTGLNIRDIARSIRANNADVVVLCGYSSTADELLDALRLEYREKSLQQRPRVVLTDGCRSRELAVRGLMVYITFPLRDLDSNDCDSADQALLSALMDTPQEQSYQMYGYDAVLLLADAVSRCAPTDISRRCVLDELRNTSNFNGACVPYSFVRGENTVCPYYVYAHEPHDDDDTGELVLKWELAAHEIFRFATSSRASSIDK